MHLLTTTCTRTGLVNCSAFNRQFCQFRWEPLVSCWTMDCVPSLQCLCNTAHTGVVLGGVVWCFVVDGHSYFNAAPSLPATQLKPAAAATRTKLPPLPPKHRFRTRSAKFIRNRQLALGTYLQVNECVQCVVCVETLQSHNVAPSLQAGYCQQCCVCE